MHVLYNRRSGLSTSSLLYFNNSKFLKDYTALRLTTPSEDVPKLLSFGNSSANNTFPDPTGPTYSRIVAFAKPTGYSGSVSIY